MSKINLEKALKELGVTMILNL